VFNIDIETYSACGGGVKVAAVAHSRARGVRASMHIIACMEDPVVIEKILTHLNEKALPIATPLLPESRAPRAKRAGSTERKETTLSTRVAAPQLYWPGRG
jgi:hypothetical protein